MEYNFSAIESKWKKIWKEQHIYKTDNDTSKPKYYILDMFPYPSGAGLHVGHPLGYIASDILARYKKMKGFNVLHPMGFDSFGLPAEQYALETGQHPSKTTEINIARYKEQLDNIGFNYDWDREIITSNPEYYKWTQWIFLQLFHSWFDKQNQKCRPLKDLIEIFEAEGNHNHPTTKESNIFSAKEWRNFSENEKRSILMNYRLAYLDFAEVWWCEQLATVLANDEVVNGLSERGGFPVEKKKMNQWFLRITDLADHLLKNLEKLEWSEAMKEMQKNWIGKSEGASIQFSILNAEEKIEIFTTRPDTIFGVDFMVLAPEHELISKITTGEQKENIDQYVRFVKSRSERERMSEKKISGSFTGSYAIHPFSGKHLPIWISEYVLAGYGTGAIMAVPSGDDRDFSFANHFQIPITNIFENQFDGTKPVTDKNATIANSDFISNLAPEQAAGKVLDRLEEENIGKRKINYKLRDAGFSRQRYWGEPFPIIYKNNIPFSIDEPELNLKKEDQILPVSLPFAENYKPGPEGAGPLANMKDFVEIKNKDGIILHRETNTMPGYAGSSWYFLRFMDPKNEHIFADPSALDYWKQVDLYIGGTEHAVGHLLYSRMWTKVLHDLGYISFDEPFKKLLNQGMIQGSSRFVFRVSGTRTFVSEGLIDQYEKIDKIHVDISIVDGVELDIAAFKKIRNREYADSELILEDGKYICGVETEKMSKSKYNVVNPDDIVHQYGADTFRMYEMFLGPIEMSKPWDTKGIEGVHRFLRKLWRLFYDDQKGLIVNTDPATSEELKLLHQTIKKVEEDTEKYSFNTAISQLMICVNGLSEMKCHKKEILEPLILLTAPFSPHIAAELYYVLGKEQSVIHAPFPKFEEKHIIESSKIYPIAINGKPRTNIEFPLDVTQSKVEETVLENEIVQKWIEGKIPKKIIFVKGRMVNIVI